MYQELNSFENIYYPNKGMNNVKYNETHAKFKVYL